MTSSCLEPAAQLLTVIVLSAVIVLALIAVCLVWRRQQSCSACQADRAAQRADWLHTRHTGELEAEPSPAAVLRSIGAAAQASARCDFANIKRPRANPYHPDTPAHARWARDYSAEWARQRGDGPAQPATEWRR